ncbi:MAG: hypothetical protein L0387_29525 [Acidobacteria bacterium]|nr:hypothetical protein [Acidobacteriota bacterium]MCI0717455.1 hypothetical protein [Acidobacteriota bacterium]
MKEKQKPSAEPAKSQPSVPADVLAAAQRHPETDWRRFPQFEQSFASPETMKDIVAKIEKTCRHLEQFRQRGTAREKVRAQSAMRAFGRTLELVRQLDDLRAKQARRK